MKVDLSKSLQAVAPWDLQIEWDGVEYNTKRPTIGLIAQLQGMSQLKAGESFSLVSEIFAAPGPDLQQWPADAILAALSLYTAYFNEQSSKNSPAIAGLVKAAMAQKAQTDSQSQTGSSES